MITVFNAFNARMRKLPVFAFACGIFFCLLTAGINYLFGKNQNLSVLYLISVVWMTWLLGYWPGICIAVMCLIFCGTWGPFHLRFFTQPSVISLDLLSLAVFMISIVYLLSTLKRSLDREQELIRVDRLTSALNARSFYEILQSEAHRCRRYNRPLTIAYIDCDELTVINDQFGLQKGDELLKLTSDIVRQGLRMTDSLARLNGDVFAVILPETHNRDAKNIFLRIRKCLSENLVIQESNLTYSIGVATFLNPPQAFDEILQKSKDLMEEVKKNGKNMISTETYGAANIS
jgi:diguanylate cyclase (GGDEF)-like protein